VTSGVVVRRRTSNSEAADERAAQREQQRLREAAANRDHTVRSKDWMDDAACREVDPDVFVTATGTTGAALRVCYGCPVVRDCGDFADQIQPTGMVMAAKIWD
jgi:hypothetical protein